MTWGFENIDSGSNRDESFCAMVDAGTHYKDPAVCGLRDLQSTSGTSNVLFLRVQSFPRTIEYVFGPLDSA